MSMAPPEKTPFSPFYWTIVEENPARSLSWPAGQPVSVDAGRVVKASRPARPWCLPWVQPEPENSPDRTTRHADRPSGVSAGRAGPVRVRETGAHGKRRGTAHSRTLARDDEIWRTIRAWARAERNRNRGVQSKTPHRANRWGAAARASNTSIDQSHPRCESRKRS